MKILDLFSGLGGWAGVFRMRGHEVVTLDLDPRFGCTVTADILTITAADLAQYGPFDGILASPPCESFSVAAFGHHWLPNRVPRTDGARTGMRIVEHTLGLIGALHPRWWLLENPRGMLRKLPMMAPYRRWTVTFCQYGDTRMKPTDLWGVPPEGWEPRPMCANGAPCHDAAPRGAKTGTQGIKGAAKRAEIPAGLAESVCLAAEGTPSPVVHPIIHPGVRMPKHRFVDTPSGAKYVEVVEDKGVRNSSAAEDATKRRCFKCHDSIGLKPFHLVNGREIHEACTKAL